MIGLDYLKKVGEKAGTNFEGAYSAFNNNYMDAMYLAQTLPKFHKSGTYIQGLKKVRSVFKKMRDQIKADKIRANKANAEAKNAAVDKMMNAWTATKDRYKKR